MNAATRLLKRPPIQHGERSVQKNLFKDTCRTKPIVIQLMMNEEDSKGKRSPLSSAKIMLRKFLRPECLPESKARGVLAKILQSMGINQLEGSPRVIRLFSSM